MKTVKLIHNPSAGDETHSKEALVKQVEEAGFECRYSSTKENGWKALEDDLDIVAVAGGGGTVRKVIKQLLKQREEKKRPVIGVIALGIANNLAKTFGLNRSSNGVINSWQTAPIKRVDIGLIKNIPT